MGRGDNEVFYGAGAPGSYLTPYQRDVQDNDLFQARLEARSGRAPAADNPLIQSSSVLGQPAQQVVPVPVDVSSNPLVPPPVPLSTMGTDQRIAWQQLNADALAKQAAHDKALIDQQIAQRQNEHGAEVLKQSRALIEESASLDPTDIKNYPLARAAIARKYPVGAGSDDVKAYFAPLDEIHKQTAGYDLWLKKEQEGQRQTTDQQRLVEARKQAEELGPEAIAKFFQLQKDKGNETAIQNVMEQGAVIKQANLVAQLQKAGMSPEEIASAYHGGATGKPFLYGAAEAEAKVRVPPGMESKRWADILGTLARQRTDARFDPTDTEPNPKWTPAQEEAYQNTFDQYNQSLNRSNRGGVLKYTPPPSAYTAPSSTIIVPPAATAPVATPTPTPKPAAPEKQVSSDGRQLATKLPNGKWKITDL